MAQFDVYAQRDDGRLLLDCQTDWLEHLATRFVIPLLPIGDLAAPVPRLNPVLDVRGEQMILWPQLAFSLRRVELGRPVASLADNRDRIIDAIDHLLTGF